MSLWINVCKCHPTSNCSLLIQFSIPISAFLFISASGGESSSWTADIPSSITALMGSCVVIPCSFDYPHFVPKPSTKFTRVWFDQDQHMVYHPNSTLVAEAFRGRVALLGDESGKDCSLVINPVRTSDTGPFHFRIEITGYNNYSYREKPVSVTVKSKYETCDHYH